MPTIHTSHERARGCGYRKKGYYLMAEGPSTPCGMFPIAVKQCPCCKHSARPTVSIGMYPIGFILPEKPVCGKDVESCCGLNKKLSELDYIATDWVGLANYPTPEHFMREGRIMGFSRRISKPPKMFTLGEDSVLIGHKKAIIDGDKHLPGYIGWYKPTHIEYVVGGDESKEDLDRMEDEGIRLVRVYEMHEEQTLLFEDNTDVGKLAALMEAGKADARLQYIKETYPDVLDVVDTVINGNLSQGKHARLASKVFNYVKKELNRGSDASNIFEAYAEDRIKRYKENQVHQ